MRKTTQGRQLKKGLAKRSWPKKENKQMDDSPVIEIRIDRVPKKTDWKEVGGAIAIKWNQRLLGLVPRAVLSTRKYRG
jgi:hypothetical protein